MQENSTNSIDEVVSFIFQLLIGCIVVGGCLALLHGCQDGGLQPVVCPVLSKPCFVNTSGAEVFYAEEGLEFVAGVCHSGRSLCDTSTGAFGSCQDYIPQGIESCNGADDDCDGAIDNARDEGICSAGLGECSAGVWACIDGATVCAAVSAPSVEACDGRDNDCDGSIDEGLVKPCYSGPQDSLGIGICAPGYAVCYSGRWTACLGEITPSTEVACNGEDEDCDGSVTDASQCLCGKPPEPEVCDGIDNDCDELIDEGVVNACGSCGEVVEESCNLIDDDCDGLTDEDSPVSNWIVLATDVSGSMGPERVGAVKAGFEQAVIDVQLLCPCNSYTIVTFPFYEADWTVLAGGVEAPEALSAISLIASGGGAIEISYDIVKAFTAGDSTTMVMVADEQGQSRTGLREADISIGTSQLLVFSDEVGSYDVFADVEQLKDGLSIGAKTSEFIKNACNP